MNCGEDFVDAGPFRQIHGQGDLGTPVRLNTNDGGCAL